MNDPVLDDIRDIIQEDVGSRGLQTDPVRNLVNTCPEDFAASCRSIASHPQAVVGVVTGFLITRARPPAAETDGPLGALFLARAFLPLGIRVILLTDGFGRNPLLAGLKACGLESRVQVLTLPGAPEHWPQFLQAGWPPFVRDTGLTHLVALERPGPSHTLASLQAQAGPQDTLGETYLDFLHEVPAEYQDRYHNMAGVDITDHHSPAHLLFEWVREHRPLIQKIQTIGIGDGGNEIGMGKVPWEVIRRNIPDGGRIACRVATDFLIVCGISNWGAYGLGAGVRRLRGHRGTDDLYSPERERQLLELMVKDGPLVDGVLATPTASVDGIPFDRYIEPLQRISLFR